jgi:phosphoribulokinase
MRDHAQLGRVIDENNQAIISHPLALSQLLVTYHLVKAALGHTVV